MTWSYIQKRELGTWCIDNEIYINIDKTKVMFFGSKTKINSAPLPTFYVDGTPLQRVQTYTYLAGWGKDGEINTACILGPYRDSRTHCGRGYA